MIRFVLTGLICYFIHSWRDWYAYSAGLYRCRKCNHEWNDTPVDTEW